MVRVVIEVDGDGVVSVGTPAAAVARSEAERDAWAFSAPAIVMDLLEGLRCAIDPKRAYGRDFAGISALLRDAAAELGERAHAFEAKVCELNEAEGSRQMWREREEAVRAVLLEKLALGESSAFSTVELLERLEGLRQGVIRRLEEDVREASRDQDGRSRTGTDDTDSTGGGDFAGAVISSMERNAEGNAREVEGGDHVAEVSKMVPRRKGKATARMVDAAMFAESAVVELRRRHAAGASIDELRGMYWENRLGKLRKWSGNRIRGVVRGGGARTGDETGDDGGECIDAGTGTRADDQGQTRTSEEGMMGVMEMPGQGVDPVEVPRETDRRPMDGCGYIQYRPLPAWSKGGTVEPVVNGGAPGLARRPPAGGPRMAGERGW